MNGAEMSGAADKFYSGDYSAIFFLAFRPGHLVSVLDVLVFAFFSGRPAIVGSGVACGFDRPPENFFHRLKNSFQFFIIKIFDSFKGMHASLP